MNGQDSQPLELDEWMQDVRQFSGACEACTQLLQGGVWLLGGACAEGHGCTRGGIPLATTGAALARFGKASWVAPQPAVTAGPAPLPRRPFAAANGFKQLAMLVVAQHMQPSEVRRAAGAGSELLRITGKPDCHCQLQTTTATAPVMFPACARALSAPLLVYDACRCNWLCVQVESLRHLFQALDEDATGTISMQQLQEAMRHMGKEVRGRGGARRLQYLVAQAQPVQLHQPPVGVLPQPVSLCTANYDPSSPAAAILSLSRSPPRLRWEKQS